MRFLHSFVTPLVLVAAGAAQAASSWGFDDATVQVNAKKAAGRKEKYVGFSSSRWDRYSAAIFHIPHIRNMMRWVM